MAKWPLNLTSLYSSWQIHLDKRVPSGAGLGGGSSNAATALWAANQFSGCLATEKELQEWSSEIGSDIPFFFSQGAAYCTGRGEVCPVSFTRKQVMRLGYKPTPCLVAKYYHKSQDNWVFEGLKTQLNCDYKRLWNVLCHMLLA